MGRSKFISWFRPFVVIGLLLGGLLYCAEEALARGGGGGGYGGSGGSSGSGGGSGGDGLAQLVVYLCVRYPAVAIPSFLTIGIVVFVYRDRLPSARLQHRVFRTRRRLMDRRESERLASELRGNDAEFDVATFDRRVEDAFLKVQAAWCSQDLEPIRHFVSDGIFERFSLQIAEQEDLGYRNQMDDIAVLGTGLVQVESDDHFDTLTVRIDARAKDYRVGAKSGKEISGTRLKEEQFTEYWSFLRRHGAQTKKGAGLLEGNCPNCGTSIEMNQSARCDACSSLLRSGEHDWVLAEITQACEWRLRKSTRIAGVDAVSKVDKNFSVQHLEDRASVVFWRRVMADRLGDIRPLSKLASSEFCERYAAESLAPRKRRTYPGDCAVGSVELVGIDSSDGWDRAVVTVRWAASKFLVADGKVNNLSDKSLRRSLFVLGRRTGVATDLNQAVASAHCSGCGAPEQLTVSHACGYCGEVLNDGASDWVLLDILKYYANDSQKLLRRLRKEGGEPGLVPSNKRGARGDGREDFRSADLIAWMVKIAAADGLDPSEREVIYSFAERRKVTAAKLESIFDAASAGEMEIDEPRNPNERLKWFEALADVALADGVVTRSEKKVLKEIGSRVGYHSVDIVQILKRRKAQLHRNARLAVRGGSRREESLRLD